ncbi:acyl-CoA-binding protein [Lutibacter sp. TH_r2]|uniref:acyl-CoA-binding protein n=1 Tax=Lutibacter sp. TH_r2 TaxID=3082083 RepID=UPI0029552D7D|nr:acyl-CoA-binding protein [Lutibacter sp. TH_r2]MDV7187180.1 acyl-CoA-binding protein [Lutibacter sp. TH_r2]
MGEDLNKEFEKAYTLASTTSTKLPPDVMLQFYAYYKQATKGNSVIFHKPSGNVELRNAFKLNAWIQIGNLSANEAKIEYIKLVKKYLE